MGHGRDIAAEGEGSAAPDTGEVAVPDAAVATAEATAPGTVADQDTDPSTGPFSTAEAESESITTSEMIAGLPRRRRGQTLTAASASASEDPQAPKPRSGKPASDPGARFSAFREAGRRKRTNGDAPAPETDES